MGTRGSVRWVRVKSEVRTKRWKMKEEKKNKKRGTRMMSLLMIITILFFDTHSDDGGDDGGGDNNRCHLLSHRCVPRLVQRALHS